MKIQLMRSMATIAMAGFLLTSCSSDSGSDEGAEPIDGVSSVDVQGEGENEDGTQPSTSPSADVADRPVIELPDDMNNVFEDTETGDPVKDAIIRDVMGRIEVMDMAFAAGDPNLKEMEFYSVGDALVSARRFVNSVSEDGLSWAGTVIYYDFTVDNEEDRAKAPIVGYCQDITELRDKDLETGEILPLSGDGTYFIHTQVVVRENGGVWQAEKVLPASDELDQRCVR